MTKLTSVWFAYVGWRKQEARTLRDSRDIHMVPYDSYDSALWGLRNEAQHFWKSGGMNPLTVFDSYTEQGILELLSDEFNNEGAEVLVEIREVAIINCTDTGWRTLAIKDRDDALRAQPPVPEHRFQTGLSSNNEVTRCVVTYNDKEYFGPWRGDEASALKAALLLIQERT